MASEARPGSKLDRWLLGDHQENALRPGPGIGRGSWLHCPMVAHGSTPWIRRRTPSRVLILDKFFAFM
jgi:hypothetical protein